MKIVFMGTPDFAVPALKALMTEHEVVCVYTQAPKEAGRGKKLTKTPVHLFAEANGIEVRTPKSLRHEAVQAALRDLRADVAVVAAYGLILPKAVLEAFPYGCLNIHASLLPRWRGAAPIQRCIEAGDSESGVTIMQVAEGLDTGDMLLAGRVPLTAETTGGSLHDALSVLGSELIVKVLRDIDRIKPEVQDDALTCYAAKIDKAESRLDFSLPAAVLERKIRAFNPYPAAYFEYNGERFKVLRAVVADGAGKPGQILDGGKRLVIACGDGMALEVTEIQRQGKKAMAAADLLRGMSFPGFAG
ncbi:MAG: methionyl-tRNA formyltransferase [Pseudomonadota bacterium]|nr:methionyl-tRNA formyltransferase [Pseudomonadota bacterium]